MLKYPDLSFDWLNKWKEKIDGERARGIELTINRYSSIIQFNTENFEVDIEDTLGGFNRTCKDWALNLLNSNDESLTTEFETMFDFDVSTAYSENVRLNKLQSQLNDGLLKDDNIHANRIEEYTNLLEAKNKAKIERLETVSQFGLRVRDKDKRLRPSFDTKDAAKTNHSYLEPLGKIVIRQDPLFLAYHLLNRPIFLKWLATFAREKCKNDGSRTCQCWTPTGRGLTAIMTSLAYLNYIYLIQEIKNRDATKLLETTLSRIKKIDDCFNVLSAAFDVHVETLWKQQIDADNRSRIASINASKGKSNKAETYKIAKSITTEIFSLNEGKGMSNSDIALKVIQKYETLRDSGNWRDFNRKPKYDTIRNNWIPKLRRGENI